MMLSNDVSKKDKPSGEALLKELKNKLLNDSIKNRSIQSNQWALHVTIHNELYNYTPREIQALLLADIRSAEKDEVWDIKAGLNSVMICVEVCSKEFLEIFVELFVEIAERKAELSQYENSEDISNKVRHQVEELSA